MILFSCWAAVVTWTAQQTNMVPSASISVMGVFGVTLTLILGFRNTAAYDRWWEARKLWGAIIANVRSVSQEVLVHLANQDDRAPLLRQVACFVHSHRLALRGGPGVMEPEIWKSQLDAAKAGTNVPAYWLRCIARDLESLSQNGALDGFGRLSLSNRLAELAACQAGNERIHTMPIPFVYSLLVRRTTYLYCAILPLALSDVVGWFSPAIELVVAYVFFGLQAVTRELEDPYSASDNGLPLDALCRVCDNTILETLGEPALPPLEPSNYRLT